jgi:hypothetical protein
VLSIQTEGRAMSCVHMTAALRPAQTARRDAHLSTVTLAHLAGWCKTICHGRSSEEIERDGVGRGACRRTIDQTTGRGSESTNTSTVVIFVRRRQLSDQAENDKPVNRETAGSWLLLLHSGFPPTYAPYHLPVSTCPGIIRRQHRRSRHGAQLCNCAGRGGH